MKENEVLEHTCKVLVFKQADYKSVGKFYRFSLIYVHRIYCFTFSLSFCNCSPLALEGSRG